MSVSPERFDFVPPTTPEQVQDEYAHLRVESFSDMPRFGQSPLALFGEIGPELVSDGNMTAEDIVVSLQYETGRSLNTRDIKNLLGWANEEITRHRDSDKLAIMTQSRRLQHLYGVDIILDDIIPEDAAG